MSYGEAMEAAGAKVISMQHFGSYQGDWWALVEHNGQCGWVNGSYGSCSGCDAFEAEFGWAYENEPNYQERLAEFGRSYLNHIMTTEEALKQASTEASWDSEADAMVQFIKDNSQ